MILPARLRKRLNQLADAFWPLPALLSLLGVLGAVCLVSLDRSGVLPPWLIDNAWVYNGGGTGARTLLGAIASSTIGVAGTVFSITIAALSLAAGQMGPACCAISRTTAVCRPRLAPSSAPSRTR